MSIYKIVTFCFLLICETFVPVDSVHRVEFNLLLFIFLFCKHNILINQLFNCRGWKAAVDEWMTATATIAGSL